MAKSANTEIIQYRKMSDSRVDVLEDRVAMQERTLKNLIDRAFKIKEDVINSLNFTQGTWKEEHKARVLLQDHVKTITNIVNKLNHEIASIEEQMRSRDSSAVTTNSTVKNLEVQHVASLTDLRGRVVRCDSAIAKLSSDMRGIADTHKSSNHTQTENNTRTLERIHLIESKIAGVNNSIDKTNSEQTMKIQNVEGDTSYQINTLDTKTRALIDELRSTLKYVQVTMKTDNEKMEQRLSQLIEKSAADTDSKLSVFSKKLDDTSKSVDARLHKLEEGMAQDRTRVDSLLKSLESKLITKHDSDIKQQTSDVSRLKRECREGFATVHESITNMKTVVDGKRRLLEDQLRRDIGQIRKMVVLV